MKKEKEPPGAENNNLHGKTLLLINTGYSKKKFILQRLKKLGVKIIMLHYEKNWADTLVDHWIISDLVDHKSAIQAVEQFTKDNKNVHIDGALTFWEDSITLTSKIVDAFGFIGISHTIVSKVHNKFNFRNYCQSQGIPTPRSMFIKKKTDLNQVHDLTFPLVMKPVYGASSSFVVKVENKDELIPTYEYLIKNMPSHPDTLEWDSLDVFIEEYIDGEEVDIDMIIQNGKIKFWSISDNYKTQEPFFIETGWNIPSSLPSVSQEKLVSMAEETLEKLGIQNGIIHFEAKIYEDMAVPIEVNMRMGGDEVYSFVKGAWGVDLIENAAKIACGIFISKINKPAKPKKYLTSHDFLSPHSGILVRLDIDEKMLKKNSVEEFHFYKKLGDPVLVPPEGFEYLGWIIASGQNLNDAHDNLRDALKHVEYKVAKYAATSAVGKTKGKSRFSFTAVNKDLILQAAKIENIKHASLEIKKLKIGVLGNNGSTTAKDIVRILKERGYSVTRFDMNDIHLLSSFVKYSKIDLIINLTEKIHGLQTMKSHSSALLDIAQIPYTGSAATTLALTQDTITFKKILAYHDIPTPQWDYMYSMDDDLDDSIPYPRMAKPILDRDSLGRTHNTLVHNDKELQSAVQYAIETLKSPLVVEEYINGDEFIVSILGNEDDIEILPIIHLQASDNKTLCPPKNIPKKLLLVITEIALDTYSILDCRDYGQVHVKIDENNNPQVIAIHANPSLAQTDMFAYAAKTGKINYPKLIEKIIHIAIKRNISSTPYYQINS